MTQASADPLLSSAAPPLVGGYELLGELAQGGMASVYLVRQAGAASARLLAMKMLLPHLRRDETLIGLFLDEARITRAVHHPNVVQVVDFGEHEEVPFLVMEWLRGPTLAQLCDGEAPPMGHLLAVLAQAAQGLEAAHNAVDGVGQPLNVVHRDVNRHNVIVTWNGDAKIVDFGIAAARGRRGRTRTGELRGTLACLAPEQIDRAHPITVRTDVWGLGVMAWETLAGRSLFRDADEASTLWNVLHQDVPPLADVASAVPAGVSEVLAACLQRDPAARPESCAVVAEALEAAARALGDGSPRAVADWLAGHLASLRRAEEARLEHLTGYAPASEQTNETVRERLPFRTPAAAAAPVLAERVPDTAEPPAPSQAKLDSPATREGGGETLPPGESSPVNSQLVASRSVDPHAAQAPSSPRRPWWRRLALALATVLLALVLLMAGARLGQRSAPASGSFASPASAAASAAGEPLAAVTAPPQSDSAAPARKRGQQDTDRSAPRASASAQVAREGASAASGSVMAQGEAPRAGRSPSRAAQAGARPALSTPPPKQARPPATSRSPASPLLGNPY